MRKQEIIHLHGLLMEVRRYYKQETDTPIDFSDYDSLEIGTSSIHRSKGEHREAVFRLTEAIADDLRNEQPPETSANAG